MSKIRYCLCGILLFLSVLFLSVIDLNATQVFNFSYTGDYQEFVAPENGYYKFEAWGAGGGKNRAQGGFTDSCARLPGYGAYTSGITYLAKGQKVYVYVGGRGSDAEVGQVVPGGWNGGGTGDYDHADNEAAGAGGGATDFRLRNGNWDDFDSLKSRVMVAGAGGGSAYELAGGYGGVLTGGSTKYSQGGGQDSGYAFGKGMDGVFVDNNIDVAGGGSGYYGGFANSNGGAGGYETSGAGGSSFVSGCTGCNAISEYATKDKIRHTGSNIHYSKLTFSNIIMTAGNASMPKYSGTGTMTGNAENGYARITKLDNSEVITNITVDESYGVLVEKTYEYSPYEYTIYLKPNQIITGDLNLEILGSPLSITGYQNIKMQSGTKINITMTKSTGEVQVYTVNFDVQKAHLKSLSFDYMKIDDFKPLRYEYSGSVTYGVKNLNYFITVNDGATYEVVGNNNLKYGENEIIITVHEDGLEAGIYKVKVVREEFQEDRKTLNSIDFEYTGSEQEYTVPKTGEYILEVWGAEGGYRTTESYAGKGGYSVGTVKLKAGTKLYIYVGGAGGHGSSGCGTTICPGGFNGGGYRYKYYGGGGASDIRFVGGSWNNSNSLLSRLIVAGGGGSDGAANKYGMFGGGESGGSTTQSCSGCSSYCGQGGKQTYSGYSSAYTATTQATTGLNSNNAAYYKGGFGFGGGGIYLSNGYGGAGGGGWYGGSGNAPDGSGDDDRGGGGGSGFIWTESTKDNVPTGYSVSSSYYLSDASTISGDKAIPSYTDNTTKVGNAGDGHVRITRINGAPILIDLNIENAKLLEPIDYERNDYRLEIPNDNFETNVSVTTDIESYIIGDKTVTFKEGEVHHIILMSLDGQITVINITPVINQPVLDNISFDEVDFDFFPNIINYEFSVPASVTSLTPHIDKKDEITYEIVGLDNLKVGNNKFKIIAKNQANKTVEYNFNVKRELEALSQNLEYTGDYQTFTASKDGYYKIEAWGASGGKNMADGVYANSYIREGGNGAYVSGTIYLNAGEKLYVYIGGKGTDGYQKTIVSGGWNGGGRGDWDHGDDEAAGAGGGATDIRLVSGEWNDFESLKSRIMVAAGGGGAAYNHTGGAGGNTVSDNTLHSTGANQTSGYQFGVGQDGVYSASNVDIAGAGGGYYGGRTGYVSGRGSYQAAGTGGSSFVSGCTGCDAISESSTSSNIIHTGQSKHYSNKVFSGIQMFKGTEEMPDYESDGKITGNASNGHVRITYKSDSEPVTDLDSLTVTPGTLTPSFTKGVYEYDVSIDDIDTKVVVDASVNNDNVLITGLGEIEIPVGSFTHQVTMADEIGNVTIYELNFNRQQNNYKFLKDILVNGISIPNFNPQVYEYDVTTPYDLDIVNVEGVKHSEGQRVQDDGVFNLDNDTLSVVIFVISEDGTENQTYTVNIKREKTSKLKSLNSTTLGVGVKFEHNKSEYELEIPKNIYEMEFTAVPFYKSAKVSITGNNYIEDGTVIHVVSHVDGVEDSIYDIKIKVALDAVSSYEKEFKYIGKTETFVVPYTGNYEIKLWGAAGGIGMNNGSLNKAPGEGAYTSGKIYLQAGTTLYVNIGGQGTNAATIDKFTGGAGGYNGGGKGGNDSNRDSQPEPAGGGGGASDIRLVDGLWNDAASLRSRLMVASGAAGGSYGAVGVPAGGLEGYKPSNSNSIATQVKGYALGVGQDGYNASAGSSGAGGGYYGGYNISGGYYSGGSGSSYISGHPGSVGTKEDGKPVSSSYTKIEDSYNYSGKYFTETQMIDGAGYLWTTVKDRLELMPSPSGGYFDSGRGNPGNGSGSIKLLSVLSSNNFLDSITLNDGDIELNFEPWVLEYDVYLLEDETSLKVDATPKDIDALIDGTGTHKIKPFDSVIPITVTATDGSIRVYNINVYREPDTDPTPNEIKVNKMTPYICNIDSSYCQYTFDKDTVLYNITVPFAINKIELLAVPKSEWQNVIYRKYNGTQYVEVENGNVDLSSGLNSFEVEVVSEDEVSSTIYTYNITRDPRGNTNVLDIKVENPTVAITYEPLVYEYSINLGAEYSSVDFLVKPELSGATVHMKSDKIFGQIQDDGYIKVTANNLGQGMNDAYIVVTALNGETKTYIFHIYKEQDTNVFLTNIEVSSGGVKYELSPKFDKLVNNYVVEVPNTVSSVDIKATSESSSATINIDNPGNLTSGMNEATISVSNGDASANVYKISIVKAKGSNPNLLNIEAVGYTLDETFDKNTTEYHLTVPKDVKKLVLKVTPEESTTTYTIRGNNNLINNMNTITITSIAENKVKKVYYLYVSKDISNNNNLSDILVSDGTLSPAFDKDTLNYNVTVDENIDRITVNGILEDVNARIVGNGEHALITGDNVIKLVVSSELGDEKTYTITVHRNESDDTTLLKVENDQNSEVIKINENSYLIDVQNEVKRINIKGYPTSSKATVSGNGYYDLVTGNNDITLMVTSESGSVGVYTVTVVRDLSKNDDLSYLFAPEGALYPTFKDTTIYYDMYVDNDVTSLNLEAIPEDNKASVKIIGNENFEVGENLVTVRVTAESGNIKEYVINVIRQEGNTDDLLLSDMSIVNQTISPDFSSYTYVYYLTVPNEVNSVMLTGEAANQNHRVIGIGNYDLRVGKNAIGLLVKNDEGLVKSYQVVVTREKSSDATLSSLVVKGHTLSPAFNKNTTSYNLNTSLTELEFTTILPTESESTYVVSGNENFVSGENTVTISVTAPDGVTVMDYVITVNRSKSKNNNLASLEVLGYTLVPTFHKGVLVYAVDVPSDVNSVIVNATAEDTTATVSGTGVVKLDAGVNEINVVVTSESNTTKTYLVIITREASDNNYLSSLFVSEGNLDPTFDKETSEYNVVVSNEIDEIGISGEVEVNSSSIKGFGTFPLNVGLNSFTVSVTSESGLIRNYVINVTREELISAKLKSLVVTDYDLDTPFDSDYFEYYINVPNEVFYVDINATPVDSNADVKISGNENFIVGMNEVTITVTSRDGLKEEIYTLYVNRQLSTNNKLLYLTTDRGELTPVFNPDTLSYTLNVDKNIEDITINAEVEDSSARIVSGTGKHLLVSGDNKIQVKVRSILGVERTYTINVNRAKSSNNNLNMLRVYDGTKILDISPTFDKDILSYDLDVSSSVKFVRLEALVQDSLASVTGDGTKSLVTGQNSYEIVVTAEDGSKKTYTVNINRTINTNNKVIDIIPSVGDYTAKFNPDIHEYTLNVNETDLFLSFEVETESDYVSVSGHEKQAIAAGNSVRVITITAEDNSVNTYKINVVKNDASNALLESLTIDGYEFEFDPNTFTYNIQVSRSKKTLLESEITAVPKDSEATVNMMGDLDLVNGMVNIYVVEVIAKDGYTTQEYKLNVTRDSLDYTLRSDVYKIVRSDEETYTEDGKTYTVIDEDYVIGIEPDTNSETFINNFLNEDKSMLHVYNLGEVMISEGNVGTSYKIKLESEDYVYDELVVIVRGDLTKDGKVNITDQAQMISYIGKVVTFDKYQTLAADITKDGKVNITDQAQIISYIGKVIKDIN